VKLIMYQGWEKCISSLISFLVFLSRCVFILYSNYNLQMDDY
jgi:hypothetical protein